MSGNEAYFPIGLKKKTVKSFLHALEAKCPDFSATSVINLYQRNAKGMVFVLDNDMIEYMEGQQIFNVDLKEHEDEPGKFDMTLEEVKE